MTLRGHELIEIGLAEAARPPVELAEGSLLNMELSHLEFQHRVLELAAEPGFPALARLRFLAIFGSNMDEFFMTRVAGFQRQLGSGRGKRTLDGLLPAEQLRLIRERTRRLLDFAYGEIMPDVRRTLRAEGIEILTAAELGERDLDTLLNRYGRGIDALLTPHPVDSRRTFPHVRNLRPTLAVEVEDGTGQPHLLLVSFPNDAPPLVPLSGGRRFIPLEEVLRLRLPRLFPGDEVRGAHLLRVTRSGNLGLRPDTDGDVVAEVEENVAVRPYQPVVRLEIEESMPQELQQRLLRELTEEALAHSSQLNEEDVYRTAGLIDLKRLERIASLPIQELKFPPERRRSPLPKGRSVFVSIRRSPVMVRFPRDAFRGTVERFIRAAADDPAVEELRITLYRTSRRSPIARLLRRARRNGKRVVALVEVKASFDERLNIEWARSLEAAGIHVLYGPPSLKVHAKIAMVRRREGDELATYSYIGTGNLNPATAATFTDLGIFTSEPEIGAELLDLFELLEDRPATAEYRQLIVAPFNMRQRFRGLIDREAGHARAGRRARITAKVNGIADKELIAALYAASQAGVRIDLLVRGICSLRPGVEGLSENIRVVGNAGRYLEHSRIFRFANGGSPEYFIGSADWRGRNLSRRIEVVVPIRMNSHRRMLDAILAEKLRDPRAWELGPDGEYRRRDTPAAAGSGT